MAKAKKVTPTVTVAPDQLFTPTQPLPNNDGHYLVSFSSKKDRKLESFNDEQKALQCYIKKAANHQSPRLYTELQVELSARIKR